LAFCHLGFGINLLRVGCRRLGRFGLAGRASDGAGAVCIAFLRMRERCSELKMKAGYLEFVGALSLNPLERLS
jgi:hypothetical protein